MRPLFLASLLALSISAPLRAAVPRDFAVDLKAVVAETTPCITLTWAQRVQGNITAQKIHRRLKGETTWVKLADLTTSQTSYADGTAQPGLEYEYWMERNLTGLTPSVAMGYLSAGVKVPELHERGKLLLLVDDTLAAPLAPEISQLKTDLAADGWMVVEIIAPRAGTAADTKALITAAYQADPANVKLVYLLGHVPVPYSGNSAPDGHGNHIGAWGADGYYGDMDGVWTDTSVNNTSAARTENRNIPGDGKFDQTQFPSPVELGVGRVDMHRLGRSPSAISATAEVEVSLLRRYLNKAHEYRHKLGQYTDIPRRTLLRDGFGHAFSSEPFAVSAWAGAFTSIGHPPDSPVDEAPNAQWWSPTYAGGQTYLWGHGCGGGSYEYASSLGNSTDFGHKTSRVVFTSVFGSYHGDWDSDSNLMRSVLAGNPDGDSLGLCCFWQGRPHWFVHPLGMGETLGHMARASMNAGLTGGSSYLPGGSSFRGTHMGLMGDPALRLHSVEPPRRLAARSHDGQVELTWAASSESGLLGYHVYRGESTAGPFIRLTPEPAIGTSYTDATVSVGSIYTYLVRTLKQEEVPGGSYHNLSVGSTVTLLASAAGTAPPRNPSELSIVSQNSSVSAQLAWQDNADDETGYRLERKVNADGAWTPLAELPADSTSHTDTGPFSHLNVYHYRVISLHAGGESIASNEASFEASAGFIELTERARIVDKTAGSVTVSVTRFGGGTGAVTVNYATSNSAASAGTHYTQTSGSLAWADGEQGEKTLTVPILNAAGPRQARQFYLTLSNPGNGARLGVFNRVSLLIEDASATLATPWQQTFFGTVSYPFGTAAHSTPATDAEGFIGSTMVGGSMASGGSSETGRFVYQQRTGDGIMTAYIRTPSPNNGSARMALMVRDSLNGNAKSAGVTASSSTGTSGYGTKLVYRSSTTLVETPSSSNQLVTPCWLRLTRAGTSFKAEHSVDNLTWTTVAQTQLANMGATAYWGLFNVAGGAAISTDYSANFQLSGFESVSFADLPSPATPTSFTATSVTDASVALAWTASDFAAGYRIERRGDDGSLDITPLANGTTVSHTDNLAASDHAYEYRIQAFNSSGDSAWSEPVRVTTFPPNLTTLITTADATGADAGIRHDSPNTSFGSATTLPVADTAPADGAPDPVAKSWLRFDLSGLPTLKSARLKLAYVGQENLEAVFGGEGSGYYRMVPRLLLETSDTWNETTLTWNNAPQNNTTGIGYTGTASLLANYYLFDFEDLPTPGDVVSLTLNVNPLNNGRGDNSQVTIALGAEAGQSGAMIWAACEHPTHAPPTLELVTAPPQPRRPGFLMVTSGVGGQVDLTWSDGSTDESGFQIERRAANGQWTLIATTAADATNHTDNGALPGVIYEYRVRALNAAGESSWSTSASLAHSAAAAITGAVFSADGITHALTDAPAGNAHVPTGLMYYASPQPFASSVTLSTSAPRNNANTWRGMKITIGAQPLTLHELARWVLSGNTGAHTVKIVDAATSLDVPGATAVVDTAGAAVGFRYAALAYPVTLAANTSYFVVSQEFSGGDTWYEGNCVVTHNATVARVDQSVWSNSDGTVYTLNNSAGNSYIPVNFRYTYDDAPFITGHSMTRLRNDFSGWLGMEITTGASAMSVSRLGRWVAPGNSGSHVVKLVDAASGATLGSTTIATAGAPAGQFQYAPLPAPLPLTPNSRYWVLSLETAGGDSWYDFTWAHAGNPAPFRQWLLSNGLPMDLAADADTNGNGIAALLEYALALPANGFQYGSHLRHGLVTDAGQSYLTLTYTRPEPAPADILYHVEACTDLQPANWDSSGLAEISSTVDGDLRTITVRDSVPMAGGNRRFMRLHVSQP